MRSKPAATSSSDPSTNVTVHPARAATSTMPEPMSPQPTTPTRCTSVASMPARSSVFVGASAYNRCMAGVGRRRFVTLSVAATGVLAGHWLTYLVTVPDARARTATLAATGHGYLSLAGELVTALAALSIAALFVGALVDAGSGPRPGRALALRLSAIQVAAFCAMEVLERVMAGSPVGALARSAILPVGVLANVGVALLGAIVLRRLLCTADRVAEVVATAAAAPILPRPTLLLPLPAAPARPSLLELATVAARGPPSPVCS